MSGTEKAGFIISETRPGFPTRLAWFAYASKPERFAVCQVRCGGSGFYYCVCQLRLQ